MSDVYITSTSGPYIAAGAYCKASIKHRSKSVRVARMDILELPFNRLIGLSRQQIAGDEWLVVQAQSDHTNHVGTLHASVLYGLAEAATGHALIQHFATGGEHPVAVVRSASVRYRAPAQHSARSLALFEPDALMKLDEQLAKSKRGLVDINVRVLNESGKESLSGTFRWFVSRQKPERLTNE